MTVCCAPISTSVHTYIHYERSVCIKLISNLLYITFSFSQSIMTSKVTFITIKSVKPERFRKDNIVS